MNAAVIVFPASNCDRDAAVALEQTTGRRPAMVWHGEASLPDTDFIVLPGGFSYGDYLRAGAMAAKSPIMRAVAEKARGGTPVLGVCNGFQVLCESGLLPGALLRNAGLSFVCRTARLRVDNARSRFTRGFKEGQFVDFPVAHHDGNYVADDETLDRLEGDGRIAFRYVDNPNGSARNIAGVLNEAGNVLGMMPHPERAISPLIGGVDGAAFFRAALEAAAGVSALRLAEDRRAARAPRHCFLQLVGKRQERFFIPVRGGEHRPDRQPVRGHRQRQGNRGIAGDIVK